jgi:hypothetical protein
VVVVVMVHCDGWKGVENGRETCCQQESFTAKCCPQVLNRSAPKTALPDTAIYELENKSVARIKLLVEHEKPENAGNRGGYCCFRLGRACCVQCALTCC